VDVFEDGHPRRPERKEKRIYIVIYSGITSSEEQYTDLIIE
jgi:hypothetical protein